MFIKDISSISEVTMACLSQLYFNSLRPFHLKDYTISFNLRHFWNDKRLTFNETEAGVTTLNSGPDFAGKIWLPDTYFVNSKEVKVQMTATTERDLLLRISNNGDVLYGSRQVNRINISIDNLIFISMSTKCINVEKHNVL